MKKIFFLFALFWNICIYAQSNPLQRSEMPTGQDLLQLQSSAATSADFVGIVKPTAIGALPELSQLGRMPNRSTTKPRNGQMDLFVFVSASMPSSLLQDYARQAKQLGAILVLRGFVQEKQSTTRQFIESNNRSGAEWMIHPEAFNLFQVQAVPAIVLADASAGSLLENGCAPPATYAKISGDVTIYAALDFFKLHSESKFANQAKKLLLSTQQQKNPR
jgi:conjugal transfer pilus assembly protein TrbC